MSQCLVCGGDIKQFRDLSGKPILACEDCGIMYYRLPNCETKPLEEASEVDLF